jgi:hypothetical protein
MTKHSKKYMLGGVKRTMMCSDCDYTIKGSIKDVEHKMELHMKYKHNVDIKTVNTRYLGMNKVNDINSNKIDGNAVMLANILDVLLKK